MTKVNCKRCGVEVLESTAAETDGQCMPCFKGRNKKHDAEQDPRYAQLLEQFRLLNHPNAEWAARTEITEHTPELSTFNFLRELWQTLTPRGEPRFLKGNGKMIEGHPFGPPSEGDGPFERLQASNADMNDVIEVVRHAEVSILLSVASLIDTVSCSGPACDDASWGLFEVNDDDTAGRMIDGLHEQILDDGIVQSLDSGDE